MIVSLIILSALVLVGAILYLDEKRRRAGDASVDTEAHTSKAGDTSVGTEARTPNEVCCGLHQVCEKSLDTIVYYDDEELDCYAGREDRNYSSSEADEFRDVMLSMKPADIPGWARSLQMRHIAMPADVRDEMLLLLSEI